MTTRHLGGLSSDQKINDVFHVYGYSIPVGKDGRRMWPKAFKQEMASRMKSGTLSVNEIKRKCQISEQTAYRWRKAAKSKATGQINPRFTEVTVDDIPEPTSNQDDHIEIVWRGVELKIGTSYPVQKLAALIQQLGSVR